MSTPRKRRKSKPLVTSLKWDTDVIVGVAHKPLKLGDLVSVMQTSDGYSTVAVQPPTLAERVEKARVAKVQADAVATQRALVKAERDAAKERKGKEAFLIKLFGAEDGRAIISLVNGDVYTILDHLFFVKKLVKQNGMIGHTVCSTGCSGISTGFVTGCPEVPAPGYYLQPHFSCPISGGVYINTLAGLGEWIKRYEDWYKGRNQNRDQVEVDHSDVDPGDTLPKKQSWFSRLWESLTS